MSVRSVSRDRAISALLSAALTLLLGWALLAGLGVRMPGATERSLDTFDVVPLPPPPLERVVPDPARNTRPEGEAAPPNLRSTATPVVAPVPIVVTPVPPPPVIAAPVAGVGGDPSQGAAAAAGPGKGAGGVGNGTGSGGSGDGDGGGWEDETPPRRVRGRLRYSDHPGADAADGVRDTVSLRYFVETDGRVSGCRVTASSGNAALDAVVCGLVTRRFRYRPSLDGRGRPVRSIVSVDHDWGVMD